MKNFPIDQRERAATRAVAKGFGASLVKPEAPLPERNVTIKRAARSPLRRFFRALALAGAVFWTVFGASELLAASIIEMKDGRFLFGLFASGFIWFGAGLAVIEDWRKSRGRRCSALEIAAMSGAIITAMLMLASLAIVLRVADQGAR